MQFITRPLQSWTRPITPRRSRSPYSVGYDRTMDDLERELRHLQVKGDVVIQIDIKESDVRRDGLPYANARVATPRVAIAFTCKHGPLTYSCDRYFDWESNVRAIALGLQRLRLVEETGIVSRGEQYTGFKALPSGIQLGPAPSTMTAEDAAAELVQLADGDIWPPALLTSPTKFKEYYRTAAKLHHPDAGGHGESWRRLQLATEILEAHFKLAGVANGR